MKQALRLIAPILLLSVIPALLITVGGCASEHDTSQIVQEGSQVIYPIGIDLNTLKGNVWTYHDMNPEGKSYTVQVRSIQNGFTSFIKGGTDVEYVGINTLGYEQLGYNSEGDLIGKTGNDQQMLFSHEGGSSAFTMGHGQYAGESVVITRVSVEVYTIKIGTKELELERGIGITKIDAPFGPGNIYGDYELESTVPDPPVHFSN